MLLSNLKHGDVFLYQKDLGFTIDVMIVECVAKYPDGKHIGKLYHGEPFQLFEEELICYFSYDMLSELNLKTGLDLREYAEKLHPERFI